MLPGEYDDYQPGTLKGRGDTYFDASQMSKHNITEWKSEIGTNKLLFVPHPLWGIEPGKHYFGQFAGVHYSQGFDRSAYLCPAIHAEEFKDLSENTSCLICERWREGQKTNNKEVIAQTSRRKKTIYLIVDMKDQETMSKGVQIYAAPFGRDDGSSGIDGPLRKWLNNPHRFAKIWTHIQGNLIEHPQLKPSAPLCCFTFERTVDKNRTDDKKWQSTGYLIMGFEPVSFLPEERVIEQAKSLPSVKEFLKYHTADHIRKKLSAGTPVTPADTWTPSEASVPWETPPITDKKNLNEVLDKLDEIKPVEDPTGSNDEPLETPF